MTSNHKITVTCKKYILRVLVALAAVVLFHPLLNALFTKMLSVLPIEFGELYVDVAIVGLTLLGAVFISLKWFEKHKYKLFVIWGFGVFLHLLDTFYWQDWDYAPMSFPMINYVVYFLYVLPFVFVIKSIVEKAHYSRIKETKTEKLNDSFGYTVHAKKLLEFIKNRKSRDSYAIGINAKWGEGKSFFIDLFKEELANSKSNEELIVVDFKPWFSHSPLDIINDFFTVFGERLEEEGIYIQSDLEKYKEALMGVETDEPILNQLLKSVKGLFDNDSKSSSLLYERINNVLKEENRRIIVVIDDLDRLTKEELFEVIKLVRNSGSLKNTFFVLAYDRTYLEEALESLQIGKHDKYLEKVIQMEVKLPIITAENYESYVGDYILSNYNKHSNDWFLLISIIDEYNKGRTDKVEIFNKDLYNIRYVESFIDKVLYNFESIKDEIDFNDYFILHLMKEEADFNINQFLKWVLENNNDVNSIKANFENVYSKNTRLIDLHTLLFINLASDFSFLGRKERRIVYLNVFSHDIKYIPMDIFIEFVVNEEKCSEAIDILNTNIAWKKDFIDRLGKLDEIDVSTADDVSKVKIGYNLIRLFNGIIKEDISIVSTTDFIIRNGVRILYNFLFLLKDKFGLSINEIKQLLFDINYACDFRAKVLGFIIRGYLSPIKVEDLQPILSKKDILFINTKFLRLALDDKSLSPIKKIGFFLELQLPSDNDKEYIFHDEAKKLMLNYIANHVNDFADIILEKELQYQIYALFGEFDDLVKWIKENELDKNDIITRYVKKHLNLSIPSKSRTLS